MAEDVLAKTCAALTPPKHVGAKVKTYSKTKTKTKLKNVFICETSFKRSSNGRTEVFYASVQLGVILLKFKSRRHCRRYQPRREFARSATLYRLPSCTGTFHR